MNLRKYADPLYLKPALIMDNFIDIFGPLGMCCQRKETSDMHGKLIDKPVPTYKVHDWRKRGFKVK